MIFFDFFSSTTERSTEKSVYVRLQLENIHALNNDRKMRCAFLAVIELVEVMSIRINEMRFEDRG